MSSPSAVDGRMYSHARLAGPGTTKRYYFRNGVGTVTVGRTLPEAGAQLLLRAGGGGGLGACGRDVARSASTNALC